MKKVFAIVGSASQNSSNLALVGKIAEMAAQEFEVDIFDRLRELPHFDPALAPEAAPPVVQEFRVKIQSADAVLICTPEYVFSIPSGLKNAIEWCVSTTVFTDKPTGIIVASGLGEKAHEELKLIMRTVGAKLNDETSILIKGARTKIFSEEVQHILSRFLEEFRRLVCK